MPKFNEVKTLFSLDTKGFDGAIKNANKNIDTVKKSVNDTKKDILSFQRALNDVSKEIKEINKLGIDLDSGDIKAAQNEVEVIKKLFNEIRRDTNALKESFENFDLKSITRANMLMEKMKETSLVDMTNLSRASNSIDKMVSQLKSIDLDLSHRLEIAAGPLTDPGLRHWIDNNGADMSQAADDTHKVLQDILMAIKNPPVNTDNNKSNSTMATNDLDKVASESRRVAGSINELTKSLKDQKDVVIDPVIKSTETYINKLEEFKQKIKETLGSSNVFSDYFSSDDNEPEKFIAAYERIRDSLKENVRYTEALEDLTANLIPHIANAAAELEAIELAIKSIEAHQGEANAEFEQGEERLKSIRAEIERIQTEINNVGMNGDADVLAGLQQQLARQHEIMQLEQERIATNRRISRSYDDSIKDLEEIRTGKKAIVKQMQDQHSAQKKINKETDEQLSKTQRLQRVLRDVLKAFNINIPGADIAGSMQQATSSILEYGQAAGQGAAASGELGTSMGALGGISVGAVAAVGAIAAAVLAAIAAFKAYVEIIKATIKVMQATIKEFTTFESAMAKVAAACRMTAEAYRGFKEEFKDGFASQGYTEDANAYADSLQRVKQQLESIQDINAEATNKKVLTIQSVTGYDPNEIIRATRNMVINLGTDVDTALDMIMSAYQKTGDPMNDLLDTMQEYPSQMQKMGISAEYFYHAIAKGSEAGVYNTDKIADTLKEFYLRVTDGSDKTIEGMNALGLSTSKTLEAFSAGGKVAETALNNVLKAVSNVQDKAQQQQIIADLFGAPGEDVGSLFFETMAEAEIVIDEFSGSVEDAASIMENTLGYQVTELKNAFATLKAEVGDSFAPVVKEIVAEVVGSMDEIKVAVTDNLIPAFQTLLIAIADPFINGLEVSDSFFVNIVNGIAVAIEGFASFINVMNGVIAVFRMLFNAVSLCLRPTALLIGTTMSLSNAIISVLGNAILGIIGAFEEFVRCFSGGFADIGVFAKNCGIGLQNAFGSAFAWIQKKAAVFFNGFVNTYNNTIGKVLGNSMNKVSWGENYTPKEYETYSTGREFGQDNVSFAIKDALNNMMEASNSMSDGLLKWGLNGSKDILDIFQAGEDLFNTFTFDKRVEESKKKIEELRKQQEKVAASQDKVNQKIDKLNTDTTTAGRDKTQKELAEEQKKLNDALKKQEELEKAILEEKKRQLEVAKQHANNMRSWQEEIISQQVKLKNSKEEAYLFEINAIEQIKQSYVLTADQMISYTQKQFDLAINLRSYYTDKYKQAIQKEIDAVKKRAKEEYEIEKKKNDKLIKDKERQIKAIDALLRQNEYDENQEDLDYEIKQTEEELQKYLYATSFEGINKRNELEERLRELRLEKERAAKKKELEDQKQQLQDEIDNIKEADEEALKKAEEKAAAMEKIYDDMFAELESVMDDGMTNIGKIQELAQKETNSVIKGLLEEYVTNYKDATDKIAQYTLSMNQILGWNNSELKNNILEGIYTEDDKLVANSQDLLDKNNGILNAEEKEKARLRYNELKKQHAALVSASNPDKTKIAQIEKEVAELRKKWGFNGFEVAASTSRMITPQTYSLPNYNNALNQQMTALDTRAGQNNGTNVTNNNGPLLNIENFNNNSNADVRRIAYEMNSNVAIKNRSKGVR